MSTDEKIIVYVVCLIGVCLIAGFLDSAARVMRWGRRRSGKRYLLCELNGIPRDPWKALRRG